MRFALAGMVCVGLLLAAPTAHAQQASWGGPVPGPPVVTDFSFLRGDSTGQAGSFGVPSFVLDPIRMALYGDAPPIGGRDRGCGPDMESVTGGSTGFGTNQQTAMRLVPHLTLTGFSRGGCSMDSALGGAMVYSQELAPKVWLVIAAGMLHLPHYRGGGPSNEKEVSADVTVDRGGGRTWRVGVSGNSGAARLHFGGTW